MNISAADDNVLHNMTTPICNDSHTHSSEYHNLKSATYFLGKYYVWIIFAVGFPGNLISFYVIVRMSRQQMITLSFFVALLAIVDNLVIIIKIAEVQIRSNKIPMDALSCKIVLFLGLTLVAFANWILIMISAERFTAVRFPMKVRAGRIWSLKRAVMIPGAVLVFLCLVHLHIFFTFTSKDSICEAYPEFKVFYQSGWLLISSSVYAFVPAICITIFNILIIISLRRFTGQRRDLMPGLDQSTVETRHQERQVTIMMLTLATVFIILTLPLCIFIITWGYWKPVDIAGVWRKIFVETLTQRIADSNHAVNFYLYFASGREFRKSALSFCKPKGCCETVSRSTTTSVYE